MRAACHVCGLFQSTPSAGRATYCHRARKHCAGISIHALRGEGDISPFAPCAKQAHFNPRPPRGGRPLEHRPVTLIIEISIHALRGEGDWTYTPEYWYHAYFNPRPPRGGRPPRSLRNATFNYNFNPRPPRGGRQRCIPADDPQRIFQSTPSAGRATLRALFLASRAARFQSTPSAGRATGQRILLSADS